MDKINIPSINIDTPIPFHLNLRASGQPLSKLYVRGFYRRVAQVEIWEVTNSYHEGKPYAYKVRTVGLAPQTKREKQFSLSERAAMVQYVNEWIAKTVAAGLAKMAEQQAAQDQIDRSRREWIEKQIADAGGVEQRRQQILREGEHIAAKEAMQYESNDVYGAVLDALINGTPIAIDNETRAKIIAKYNGNVKESWSVKTYIDSRMQELNTHLAEISTEVAA